MMNALNEFKNGKSPGEDGVPIEFYKNLPSNWLFFMHNLFNKIITQGRVPDSWSSLVAVMIYKKGEQLDPDNYRMISLVNAETKTFTQMLSTRLTKWSSLTATIPEFQAGFRAGRSCEDNIFVLNSLIQIHLRAPRGKVYALFVDFKRAFDSVNQGKLWQQMYTKLGISASFINILIDFYDKAKISVRTTEGLSESVDITEGVLQGETLSPTLFSLFLSDLEDCFRSEGARGISVNHETDILLLAYADDIVIFSHSPVDMNKQLNILKSYCDDNLLNINTSKTQVVIFGKNGRRPKNIPTFRYGQDQIDLVRRYTYLGIPFESSGTFLQATKSFTQAATLASSSVIRILNSSKSISWDTRERLFEAMVESVLSYGVPFWGLRYADKCEMIQTRFFKRILLLPNQTLNYCVRLETNRAPLEVNFVDRALNFVGRLLRINQERYPKLCFDRLRALEKNGNCDAKFNWCKQIGDIFRRCDLEEQWTNLSPSNVHTVVKSITDKLAFLLREKDCESLRNSSATFVFKRIFLRENPAPYLTRRMPIFYTRALAQLRLFNAYNPKIDKRYEIRFLPKCKICSTGERDEIIHTLENCPALRDLRVKFFEKLESLELHTLTWVELLNCDVLLVIKFIVNYIIECLKKRENLINQDFEM